jgi:molecular chaperone DnaK
MVKEAEAHASEDKRQRELVEARNQADAMIYTVEKTAKEATAPVADELRNEIQQAITALRQAMSGDDVQRIRQGGEGLSQLSTRLAQALSQPAASSNSTKGGESDVVDAEFEEVNDRNRKTG